MHKQKPPPWPSRGILSSPPEFLLHNLVVRVRSASLYVGFGGSSTREEDLAVRALRIEVLVCRSHPGFPWHTTAHDQVLGQVQPDGGGAITFLSFSLTIVLHT